MTLATPPTATASAPLGEEEGAFIEQGDSPIEEDHYVLGGGLRQVVPYLFDFKCTVKPRSEGANLVDFMEAEFPAMPRAYYEDAVASGRARAAAPGRGGAARPPRSQRKRGGDDDGRPSPQYFTPLDPAAPLSHNACVRHLLHRHEPPALDLPVPLLGEVGDLFAVGKPPGLPVHAAGGYRKNTVVGVLEAAARAKAAAAGGGASTIPITPPRPCHRLDKPVSGVLVFARTAAAAEAAARAIARREVAKTYVARVAGVFPGGVGEAAAAVPALAAHLSPADAAASLPPSAFTLDLALAWDPALHAATTVPDGPRLADGEERAGRAASAGGRAAPKPAATIFHRLATTPDGATSLVSCRPLTGRSHQIRVHLAALGHPIANDGAYGGAWPGPERPRLPAHGGPPAPRGGTCGGGSGGGADAAADLDDGGHAGVGAALAALAQCQWVGLGGGVDGGNQRQKRPPPRQPAPHPPAASGPTAAAALAACPFCPDLARPWSPRELLPLWLHAAKYVGPGWAFECPPPAWAEDGWVAPPRPL